MAKTVTTSQAVRLLGAWARRADAVLNDGAVANAARAVDDERRRAEQHEAELAAIDLRDAERSSQRTLAV